MSAFDDPIIKARKERFVAHLPGTPDLALITLKGHLLIEEILDDIIALHCRQPAVLADANIKFFVKSRFAQALVGDSVPDDLWPMIEALNSLRNDLAHKLESPKLESRVAKFISITYGRLDAFEPDAPVAANLRGSMAYMFGYLAAHEYRVRSGSISALPVGA
jgi:hypothetical protein